MIAALKNVLLGEAKTAPPARFPEFYRCLFSLLAKVVIADGKYCDHEVSEIRNFIDDGLRLDPREKRTCWYFFNKALGAPFQARLYSDRFHKLFPKEDLLKEIIFDCLIQVTFSDSILDEQEARIITDVARSFKFEENKADALNFKFSSDKNDSLSLYYRLLGAAPDDDSEALHVKYEELLLRYDPLKLQSEGFPLSLIEFLEFRMERIKQAFAILLENHANPSV